MVERKGEGRRAVAFPSLIWGAGFLQYGKAVENWQVGGPAKRDLALEAELRKLDRFDAFIVDDIGYIQQDRDEMEVLFTSIGERYERRSLLLTSNLVFSQWDRIFKDTLTTAAAIDRVVHHCTILELTAKNSYRADSAKKRNSAE